MATTSTSIAYYCHSIACSSSGTLLALPTQPLLGGRRVRGRNAAGQPTWPWCCVLAMRPCLTDACAQIVQMAHSVHVLNDGDVMVFGGDNECHFCREQNISLLPVIPIHGSHFAGFKVTPPEDGPSQPLKAMQATRGVHVEVFSALPLAPSRSSCNSRPLERKGRWQGHRQCFPQPS